VVPLNANVVQRLPIYAGSNGDTRIGIRVFEFAKTKAVQGVAPQNVASGVAMKRVTESANAMESANVSFTDEFYLMYKGNARIVFIVQRVRQGSRYS